MTNAVDYIDKTVILTAEIDGEKKTIEGTVTAASAAGIVFKEKGKRGQILVEAADIANIEIVDTGSRLKQRSLRPVADGKMRDHLVDRHGYKVSDIEAFSEEAAVALHDSIDHDDLGHRHRKARAVEAAIAEAEEGLEDGFSGELEDE